VAITDLEADGFQIEFHSHAFAIMKLDFPSLLDELEEALVDLTIPIHEIVGSGGGESKGTQRLRRSLSQQGWSKVNFSIEKRINGIVRESQSHEVDHVREVVPLQGSGPTDAIGVQRVALEIEWNNKDPFFDRDLENFKRLHAEAAISVGVIVTRGESLQSDLKQMVLRFAHDKGLERLEDLERLGLAPTARQKREIMKRVERGVSFAEAWSGQFVQDKYGAATTHWSKLQDRVDRGVGNPCPLVLIGLPSAIVTFEGPDSPDDDES